MSRRVQDPTHSFPTQIAQSHFRLPNSLTETSINAVGTKKNILTKDVAALLRKVEMSENRY